MMRIQEREATYQILVQWARKSLEKFEFAVNANVMATMVRMLIESEPISGLGGWIMPISFLCGFSMLIQLTVIWT